MENASKALIIAGAILLAILIISLGIIVYNQAKGTTKNINLSEYEIQVFNKKFTRYEGGNVTGRDANNLIETVLSSNEANVRDKTGMYVCLLYPPIGGDRLYGQYWVYTWTGVKNEGDLEKVVYGNGTSVYGGLTSVFYYGAYGPGESTKNAHTTNVSELRLESKS